MMRSDSCRREYDAKPISWIVLVSCHKTACDDEFHETGEGQGEGKNRGLVPHHGSAVEVLDGSWCLFIANMYIYRDDS